MEKNLREFEVLAVLSALGINHTDDVVDFLAEFFSSELIETARERAN